MLIKKNTRINKNRHNNIRAIDYLEDYIKNKYLSKSIQHKIKAHISKKRIELSKLDKKIKHNYQKLNNKVFAYRNPVIKLKQNPLIIGD